jgi:hypothetical protein
MRNYSEGSFPDEGSPGHSLSPYIHRSAWKVNSANFVLWMFSEVRSEPAQPPNLSPDRPHGLSSQLL